MLRNVDEATILGGVDPDIHPALTGRYRGIDRGESAIYPRGKTECAEACGQHDCAEESGWSRILGPTRGGDPGAERSQTPVL